MRAFLAALLFGAAALLVTGCGGVSASRSVSPASFLLPGLLEYHPRPATPGPDDAVRPERDGGFAA
ncbi:MAG: hypothetical protein ACKVYV_16115 [Limisphaerales bacterium]